MESEDEVLSNQSEDEVEVVKRTLKVKFDITHETVREVLFCEHRTATPSPEKPLMRTLFLSKVPTWATEDSLARIFSCNGPVQKVYLSVNASPGVDPLDDERADELKRYLHTVRHEAGFKYGYVVFEKPLSMKKAINEMDLSHPFILSTTENPIVTGLKKWKREFKSRILPDSKVDDLKAEIDTYIKNMDEKADEVKRKAEEEAEPDDDGWVTISRKSKKKSTIGAGRSEKVRARMKAREAKKKRNLELRKFYKFQLKETKLKKLDELRERFQAHRKVQEKTMPSDRKFKPS